jgi:proteasome lid subunit RPN8/RPN11/molybdopterin converting factor small subunit
MPVTVRLPGALRDATDGETKLTASGRTLREVIADIDRRHPGFAARVLDERGALRSYVNVYIGDADARASGGTAAAVPDGSEIMVIPAMAGGAPALAERRRLVLPRRLKDEIVAHARESAPRECCGLLFGDGEVADRLVRGRNVHPTPETRYEIDPKQLRDALGQSDDPDRYLVAIYHSHPRTQPEPSDFDRANALWPEQIYVLTSVLVKPEQVFAYRIKDGKSSPIDVVLT